MSYYSVRFTYYFKKGRLGGAGQEADGYQGLGYPRHIFGVCHSIGRLPALAP